MQVHLMNDSVFSYISKQNETKKAFNEYKVNTEVDHQMELICHFPEYLESSDCISTLNHIWLTPAYQQEGYSKEIEYALGFFRNKELIKVSEHWRPQGIGFCMRCQYGVDDYLSWHRDLPDGEYELRLIYRIINETPNDELWIMPSHRDGEAAVYMELKDGHASFRQVNRHPCELKVNALHTSVACEVGLQNSFTIDLTRTSDMEYDDVSDIFCYVNDEYVGLNSINMKDKTSISYTVSDFFDSYIYYFTPEHTGKYNVKIIDGRSHLLYEEDIEVAEGKNYQLSVNHANFIHSIVPNTINSGIEVELEIENIGQYRYKGDIVCRPIIDLNNESLFLPSRFQLDIAPGEVVKQILLMDFDFYLALSDVMIIKCYYTSNGRETLLWQSDTLNYIDPETNNIIRPVKQTQTQSRLVYNLQGMIVASEEQFDKLPSGIYIIGGKKRIK